MQQSRAFEHYDTQMCIPASVVPGSIDGAPYKRAVPWNIEERSSTRTAALFVVKLREHSGLGPVVSANEQMHVSAALRCDASSLEKYFRS